MAAPDEDNAPSPTRDAAMRVLRTLDISHPPITQHWILAGLNLVVKPLPSFDMDRLPPEHEGKIRSIRGLLSPEERVIYLAPGVTARQAPWIVYHESGHNEIEWHRDVLYLDTSHTLDPRVRILMEQEANEFAGHLQFLGPRFALEARDLPYGLGSVIALADRYGSSYESAIRRYVETQTLDCFCEVFKIVPVDMGQRALKFRYFIRPQGSAKSWKADSRIGTQLPVDHPTVRLLNDGVFDDFSIREDTRYDPETRIAYHEQSISNRYHLFVLTRAIESLTVASHL